MDAPITIIGSGHAGYTLARELRRLDSAAPLRIITADDGASYYKPDLSKAFAAGKTPSSLQRADAAAMAAQLGAEVLHGRSVDQLNPAARTLGIGGESLPYARLVLATGARQIRLPLAGSAADRAVSINSLGDYAALRARLQPGQHVLIIGAGLIGAEFANDLAAAGFRMTVVDIAAWPLARLVPEAAGRAVQQALEALGVTWRLSNQVVSLDSDGEGIAVQLAEGPALKVDHVLTAVGLRPDLDLARRAGLACRQGLLVDDYLQTSARDVYALGDCIEIGGCLMPYILPIAHAARALAQTLAGRPTAVQFPLMPVAVKTPACPVLIAPPPPAPGQWDIQGTDRDIEAIYRGEDGQALGFVLTGSALTRRAAVTALLPPVRLTPRPPVGQANQTGAHG